MKPAKAAKASLSEELKKKITELDSRIFHLERRKSEEKTTFMHCCYIIDNEIYVNVDYTNLMLENTHTHTHTHTHKYEFASAGSIIKLREFHRAIVTMR